MENSQLDSFIEYLYVVEENSTVLTHDQIKKLELIQSKVSEIVKKVEAKAASTSAQPKLTVAQPVLAETRVARFEEFQELNEKILKRGSKWVVTDKSGKKVLGTHPSREKAVKQLQAIEISKMGR